MARPRDERIDQAVLSAVTELLREVGYSALTMEAIAQRAGTTKPAIRRRWRSQRHLVIEAMANDRIGVVEVDTGCTHCDLVEHIQALQDGMADPAFARVLPALVADLADDPELRKSFLDVVWEPRRAACIVTLEQGWRRAELRPGLDVDLVLDLFAAPIVFRALFGHRELGPEFPREVANAVLRGVGLGGECRRENSGQHP
ncbi:TetR/AcrR family transcriptional regulator [Kutzneria albida]|uniref:HTH tetR-type domain-containing protein n=1 Tax=Kutzneria albida DSM 43870 TaxID=1449976 RepID=W5W549_9PSEU|nr:TetR/AcrR family transcriptional regulator [Kutzneria albida]AHH95895.1 hypothetical protein KALB_2527 [Kutzneria albida DSM 43870]